MKRALAILAVCSLFAFAGLAQGTLTGQWDFDFTFGMRDVVITDPGATITIAGGTYAVSQGLVTIPDKTVTINVEGQEIPLTIPGDTYICNGSITIPGGTYNVEGATVTIPEHPGVVTIEGETYTCTIPPFTFEVPDLDDKLADIKYPVEDKVVDDGIEVTDPEITWEYGGTVHYTYVLYQQTSSVVLQTGEGYLDIPDVDGIVDAGDFDWCNLCWHGFPATITLPFFHLELHPDNKTFQVDFAPVDVVVKCDDALYRGYTLIVGRKGFGQDAIGNVVEIIIDPHEVTYDVTDPYLTVEQNWAYTPDPFDGSHYLFFEIPKTEFDIDMPDGWPWCCEDAPDPVPRPTVEIGWSDLDVFVYQYTGDYTELEEVKNDVATYGTDVLDKMGLAFVDLGPEEYPIDCDDDKEPVLKIEQGDLLGEANLGAFSAGETEITVPGHTCTITIDDLLKEVTVVIPEQTVDVTNGTVTIEDQVLTFEGTVTIPDYNTTIVVDGQSIEVTIPGGTYEVSDQYVTIPDRTITIPGWSQTIEKLPDFGFKTSLKLTYTLGCLTITSVSKFEDATFSDQSFSLSWTMGAVSASGAISFDPTTPAYKSAWIKLSLAFAGIDTSLKVAHDPNKMVYTLKASTDCLSATLTFQDDCTGIYFKDALVSMKDIGFCCGVTYDVAFSFSKANGFEYVKFSAKNLFPICCGISFDISIKFTTDYKEVSIKPVLAKIGDACFTLYADLDWSDNAIGALEVYGWKIKCELGDCNYIEFLTALDPSYKAFSGLFKGEEFEYVKFGFCGAGCCGGTYKVDLAIYFDNGGGLFGISRFGAKLEIPVMSNFTVRASFSTMEPVLGFGWTFKF